jgi:hypothetical protein
MKNKVRAWCEARIDALQVWTLRFGMLMAVIGFPMQIYQTWQDQHCGIHIFLVVVALLIYGVRIPYCIGKQAWALIPPDTIGLTSSLVLLIQTVYYNYLLA